VNESRTVRPAPQLRGSLAVPGDKSITHRALMLGALADGESRIERFLDADDTRSTLACVRALGAEVEELGAGEPGGGALLVHGRGRAALHEAGDVLDCGNSGTAIRLLTGLLAGLPGLAVLTGDASVRQRPMARIVQPLRALGADVAARAEGTLPPIVVRGGALDGGRRVETPVASAQVKSALLLAALAADGPTTVVEPAATRDHTERMLAARGARVESAAAPGGGFEVTLHPPPGDLAPDDVTVPGDISGAAFWLVAAALHPDAELTLTGVGVNPTRTGILDVLGAMGAEIELLEERVSGGEPVADLHVRSSTLRGTRVDGALVPRAIDELPLVALAGALAEGETVIAGAAELSVKESDRIAETARMLSAFGVQVEERPDGLHVHGGVERLRGARVDARGDHRLAMLAAVAGLLATGETVVDGAEAASVSYPAFWEELERLQPSSTGVSG
jgi:3-phosphoshikimate 1-carboxyvinyltransferase